MTDATEAIAGLRWARAYNTEHHIRPRQIVELLAHIDAQVKEIEELKHDLNECLVIVQEHLAEIERLTAERDEKAAELANLQVAFNDWKVFHSTARIEAENERLRERVMDQEERHADALQEIEFLREWIVWDTHCPCCQQTQVCSDDCTFSVDSPQDYERMKCAREFLAHPDSLCKCDMRTKLVGDGCEFCNPELAEELKEQE